MSSITPNAITLTPGAQAGRSTSPFGRTIWTPTWIKHLTSTGSTEQPPWFLIRIWFQVPNKVAT